MINGIIYSSQLCAHLKFGGSIINGRRREYFGTQQILPHRVNQFNHWESSLAKFSKVGGTYISKHTSSTSGNRETRYVHIVALVVTRKLETTKMFIQICIDKIQKNTAIKMNTVTCINLDTQQITLYNKSKLCKGMYIAFKE